MTGSSGSGKEGETSWQAEGVACTKYRCPYKLWFQITARCLHGMLLVSCLVLLGPLNQPMLPAPLFGGLCALLLKAGSCNLT